MKYSVALADTSIFQSSLKFECYLSMAHLAHFKFSQAHPNLPRSAHKDTKAYPVRPVVKAHNTDPVPRNSDASRIIRGQEAIHDDGNHEVPFAVQVDLGGFCTGQLVGEFLAIDQTGVLPNRTEPEHLEFWQNHTKTWYPY